MFDPFGDFATEGYLRNFDKEQDLEIVKIAEIITRKNPQHIVPIHFYASQVSSLEESRGKMGNR